MIYSVFPNEWTIMIEKTLCRIVAICIGVNICFAAIAFGQSVVKLTSQEAHDLSRRGEVQIIDVRMPTEWKQSGLPQHAVGATIRRGGDNRAFLNRIAEITGGDKTKSIALICASGVRSRMASRLLIAEGYTRVFDIAGGMFGNSSFRGWLSDKLPTQSCKTCN